MVNAWLDEGFKQRLLDDANQAAAEMGIVASNPNAPTKLVVVENTEHLHNLVVCTLCSCYPAALVGPAPLWYKSSAYRARAVRRPRRLLAEAHGPQRDVAVARKRSLQARDLVRAALERKDRMAVRATDLCLVGAGSAHVDKEGLAVQLAVRPGRGVGI